MDLDELIQRYPMIYHMADMRNWDNICKHGLLSTTALLDLFGRGGDERFEIESQLRCQTYCIKHPEHGMAFIRDQDPMRDRPERGISLAKCLDGITPREWFELLNGKVFFWADTKGLGFMLGARLYHEKSHYVITVDTRKLLDRHASEITLTSINTGSLYKKELRSRDTFVQIADHTARWVTELAVDYSVPDILTLAISVDEQKSVWCDGRKEIKKVRRVWPT